MFLTKRRRDKLKILPRNRPGLDFDILHQEEPGHDFDSMFCPVLEYPGTAMGQKGRKSNNFFLTFLTFFEIVFDNQIQICNIP